MFIVKQTYRGNPSLFTAGCLQETPVNLLGFAFEGSVINNPNDLSSKEREMLKSLF